LNGKSLKVIIKMARDVYTGITILNKDGKEIKVDYHGYLVGLIDALKLRVDNDWDGLVIVTGGVGDGKSSLTEGLMALYQHQRGKQLSFDNITWTSKGFVSKTDRDDNFGEPIWWDEAIQGAGGKKMAMTNEGDALKNAMVTKRFKHHLYFLLVDEIEEYAWKLIKKASAWIHVKSFGLERGYFDCYVSKSKIQFLYNAFKIYKKTWDSPEVRGIFPDCKGKYQDYSGMFLDKAEYNEMKLEETRQLEEVKTPKVKKTNPDKQTAIDLWQTGECKTHSQVAKQLGLNRRTVTDYINSVILP
jgi:hypothetical protein